jgi:hypothetical protein
MNRVLAWLAVMALNLLSLPAFGQTYESPGQAMTVNPWQDTAGAPTGTAATGQSTLAWSRFAGQLASTAGLADQSVNTAPLDSGQFNLGFPAAGPQTGRYGSVLPPVATSSVNLSICVAPAPNPPCGSSGGQSGGSGNGSHEQVELPYTPGLDWAAVYNSHDGSLMGYMAPGETYAEFFSGQSGHLLASQAPEGQYILQNQLGDMAGSTATGF